jgi:hypothetical protein
LKVRKLEYFCGRIAKAPEIGVEELELYHNLKLNLSLGARQIAH